MQFPHFILHFYYPNGLFYQENLGQPIWIRLHIFVVSFAINCDYHYTHATCKKFKCLNAFSVFASKMQLILGALRMGQLTVTFSYKHTVLVQRHSKSSHSASQERIDERLCSVCVCVVVACSISDEKFQMRWSRKLVLWKKGNFQHFSWLKSQTKPNSMWILDMCEMSTLNVKFIIE